MGFKGKSGLGAGLHLSAMPGHISKRSNDINMEISAKNIWDQRALNSEIEFSRALLSEPIEYPDFIHMVNLHVAWCGDFNRALKVKFTDFLSFERIVAQVEQIHHEKGLDRPDRYDISEPELDDRLGVTICSRRDIAYRQRFSSMHSRDHSHCLGVTRFIHHPAENILIGMLA